MPRRIYVYTETSTHIIDPEGMTVKRVPGTGLGPDSKGSPTVAQLRRENEELILWEMPTPVIGHRMELLLQIRDDEIKTARSTTHVRDIREVVGEDEVLPDLP